MKRILFRDYFKPRIRLSRTEKLRVGFKKVIVKYINVFEKFIAGTFSKITSHREVLIG